MITAYLNKRGRNRWVGLIPATVMTYVCSSYVFVSPLMCGMRDRAAAYLLGGDLQPEPVPRLQQHAFRLHQSVPHGPVGGLSKIAALGVLFVGAARQQGDFDIGDG